MKNNVPHVKFPRAEASDSSSGWIINPAHLRKVKRSVDARQQVDMDMEQIEEVLLAIEKVQS